MSPLSLSTALGCVATAAACFCPNRTPGIAYRGLRWLIVQPFYVGYHLPADAEQRRQGLIEKYHAEEFVCEKIDALYLKATKNPTGNLLILCLNTTYQDQHPRHWEPFLNNGSDILLWNPTELGPVAYAEDLTQILRTLRERNPAQVIVVKTYCASSDSGISAVAALKDPHIHLIIDRGHGDALQLARSFTILAKLPLAQRVLKDHFDCQGVVKIKEVQGRILFFSPRTLDQLMGWRGRNFTQQLHEVRPDQQLVRMQTEDHWQNWSLPTYRAALDFLASLQVVSSQDVDEAEIPLPKTPSCLEKIGRNPLIIKSCL